MAEPELSEKDKLRAQGVALLTAGESLGAVAKLLSVSKATVQGWNDWRLGKGRYAGRMHTANTTKQVQNVTVLPPGDGRMHTGTHTQKKTREELVNELIDEKLETLIAQERHFRDKDWLERQNAYDLAYLNGTSTDKLIRMNQAAEQAPPPRRNSQGQAELPLHEPEKPS